MHPIAVLTLLSVSSYNLLAANFSSSVGNVESEEGTAVLEMTDSDVTISSSTSLRLGEINTNGRVTIKTYDKTPRDNGAAVGEMHKPHDTPASSLCHETSHSPIEGQSKDEYKRILGTELSCNYDLFEYRDYHAGTEIKGTIKFIHRGTNKVLVTEFGGIALGDRSRQKSGQVRGKNIQHSALKTVTDFQELMVWIRDIEALLAQ